MSYLYLLDLATLLRRKNKTCECALSRNIFWASLVAQWLRICLPVQGTQVQALVGEGPTCHRATKLVRHNY